MLAAVVIGVSVAGLVTLNAFLAQASFRIDDLEGRLGGLAGRYQTLSRETAHPPPAGSPPGLSAMACVSPTLATSTSSMCRAPVRRPRPGKRTLSIGAARL